MLRKNAKKFVRDAIIAFIFWTAVLTPLMIFIVKIDIPQYLSWLQTQAIFGPPLGAISAIVFRWANSKWPY